MKVLFAMRKESVSKSISDMYYERYGETLEYKNVFFFKALIEEVKNNKTYDRIVIDEDLEEYRTKDIEQLDKALFNNIDRVTDEASNAEIILVCTDRREKGDPIINKLFSIGIYNLLLGDDRNINPLCDIIRKPKTKKEAKQYLNIDTSLIGSDSVTRDEEVEEEQMISIIKYYEGIKNQPEKYVSTFDEIAKQYSRVQLTIIVSYLPKNVRDAILKEDRYKYLATGDINSNVYTTVAGAEAVPKQQITGTAPTKPQEGTLPRKTGGIFGKIKNKLNIGEGGPKEAEALVQNDKKENSQEELLARARREAEERERQEKMNEEAKINAEKSEAEARAEVEKAAEEAKKKAEREQKEQEELLEKAKREAEEREKQEKMDAQAKINAEKAQAQAMNETEKVEAEAKAKAEAEAKAKVEQEEKEQEERRRLLEEEQRKIKEAQEKLEEEKRRLKEEQERLVNEQNKLRESANELQYASQYANNIGNVNSTSQAAMRMVVIVGANKAGTTFMTNAIAHSLANAKIKTSILDMTRDKSMFYLYNQDDKGMRKKAAECMQRVSEGEDIYLDTNSSYLKVYTTVPGSVSDVRRSFKHKTIIDTVKTNCDVVIVDADFSTPVDYFEQADAIFLVQDLDLLKMPDVTSFLRELKNRGMNMKKIQIIINKYVKTSLSPKQMVQALSYYTDPNMSFVDEILPSKVEYTIIPYNLNNYVKYTDAVRAGVITFKGYSEDFVQAIGELQKIITAGSNIRNKGRKLF